MNGLGDLYKVVEFLKKNSTVEKMSIARMSLTVGEDVTKITPGALGEQEKFNKFVKAAESITNKKFE